MSENLSELLGTAAKDVLETMYFAEAYAVDPSEFTDPPGVLARVRFRGDLQGTLDVGISASSAERLAADFLGESTVTPDQIVMNVCEMANMICGSVLSSSRHDGYFRLDSPVIENAPQPPTAPVESCTLDLGDGVLFIRMALLEPRDAV
jgi:CheY-specific phosphatase CheX